MKKIFDSIRGKSSRSSRPSVLDTAAASDAGSSSSGGGGGGDGASEPSKPQPPAELTLTGYVEYPSVPLTQVDGLIAMASIRGPVMPQTEKPRGNVDLIACIDVSGSMAGQKLTLTKEAMHFLIDQLSDDDQLAVVAYDTHVKVVFPFNKIGRDNGREKAHAAVRALAEGSSTNLHGGLMESLKVAAHRKKKNEVCSVLLFTDGQANVGPTQAGPICDGVREKLEDVSGSCNVFTFGFGSDHSADLLQAIAESAHGLYYYISSTDKIPESFADCLGGLKSVCAQNLKVTFAVPEDSGGAVILETLNTSYRSTGTLPGQTLTLAMGDLYYEESRELLVRVRLPATAAPVLRHVFLDATLEYFDLASAQPATLAATFYVERAESVESKRPRDVEVDRHYNRVRVANALLASKKRADDGDLDGAREDLGALLADVRTSTSANEPYTKALERQLEQTLSGMQDHSEYTSVTSKLMSTHAMQHNYQRAAMEDEGTDMYSNMSKAAYRGAAKSRLSSK